MTTLSDDQIILDVVRREGGYVDHPDDRGGPTNFGITQATLTQYRGRAATRQDMRDLTLTEAKEIYRTQYMQPFSALLSSALRAQCFDAAVQHGVAQSVRWLQRAIGVKADGRLGPLTAEAANRAPAKQVAAFVIRSRLELYGSLITRDRSQSVFAAGWMRRMGEMVEFLVKH